MLDTVFQTRLPLPGPHASGKELFRLGMSYATGLGAPMDLVSAHALFDLAARRGSLEAKVYRKELGLEMDSADVAEAQRVVGDWLRAANSAVTAPMGVWPKSGVAAG
jgi:TPR repeat protein